MKTATKTSATRSAPVMKRASSKSSSVKSPLPKEAYQKNAGIYKILANSKRLEILNVLKLGETAVEDLLKITKTSKANLSQHLALLRHNGLVQTRREGLNVFYTIVDPRIVEPCKILHNLRHKRPVL
jgi:DNA-binding transcriptional ArsR family regulator